MTRPRFPVRTFTIMLLAMLATTACELGRRNETEPPIYTELADFALTERSGISVRRDTLRGKVTLMNFIFTTCSGPCPLMSGHMKTLQAHYAKQAGVRFVSITTDPATDTPPVLAAYADRLGADAQRWLFLTGDKAEIVRLSRDVLKLPAGEEPNMHSARFVVIDQTGKVRAYRDSQDADFQDVIRRDVDWLLAANAATYH